MTKSVDSFHFAFVRAVIFALVAAPIVFFLEKDPFPKGKYVFLNMILIYDVPQPQSIG